MHLDAELLTVDWEASSNNLVRNRDLWNSRLLGAAETIHWALSKNLHPTPYLVEAHHYWHRASGLQRRNLGKRGWSSYDCGDPLQQQIPIYDTVQRRYAGFSNVLEQLWYGPKAPKFKKNKLHGRDYPKFGGTDEAWAYVCLIHRLTGSGASFEHDHGWRNCGVPEMAAQKTIPMMSKFIGDHPGPCFTSIGNQIPSFMPRTDHRYRTAGQQYCAEVAPKIVRAVMEKYLTQRRTITETIDWALSHQVRLGHRRFIFVFTAWVMDLAEYFPHLVDPNSDVYHGKNAQEALSLCFRPLRRMGKQKFFDVGTRVFSHLTGTYPMDVEDAAPGCDLIRWVENYVPKKGFDHIIENKVFNSSSLAFHSGRQP